MSSSEFVRGGQDAFVSFFWIEGSSLVFLGLHLMWWVGISKKARGQQHLPYKSRKKVAPYVILFQVFSSDQHSNTPFDVRCFSSYVYALVKSLASVRNECEAHK